MANATFSGLQPSPGTALAILASGTNPDGSAFTMVVGGGLFANQGNSNAGITGASPNLSWPVALAYSKFYISTLGAKTPKASAGLLHAITVNTPAVGTITLQDGGVTFAVVTLTASTLPGTVIAYDVNFLTNLTVNPSVGMDLTVSFL